MGKLNKLTDVEQNVIVSAYNHGDSLKSIATRLSCTAPTIATFLRSKGVTVRGKGKRKGMTLVKEITTMPVIDTVEFVKDDDFSLDQSYVSEDV